MRKTPTRTFACDFETTVYDGQDHTEVWSAALVEIGKDNEPVVLGSLGDMVGYFNRLNCNIIAYFHNLKFDGSFWLNWLLRNGYSQGYTVKSADNFLVEFTEPKYLKPKSFTYSISSDGLWYKIFIKLFTGKTIEIRDSLKLLPFTLKEIGKSFKTKHQKLDMEYKGYRHEHCLITPQEMEYIKNDVLVLKEALEIMFAKGETRLTIGSCCLEEYKSLMKNKTEDKFVKMFPALDEKHSKDGKTYNVIDAKQFGSETVDQYIRKSYRGGWCYLVRGKENIHYKFRQRNSRGSTADVNSLYPSMMHSESGNYYPVGQPTFWIGSIPKFLTRPDAYKSAYYFIRVRCRFELKEGYLPTIQIKGSMYYRGTEMLETSDYVDSAGKRHLYGTFVDETGEEYEGRLKPTLTLTQTDWQLIQEHYNLYDVEILDGCYFRAEKGIFDKYIDKWKDVKVKSVGAMRTLAKLFLNNLYGKFATSSVGDFKVASLDENGRLVFKNVRDIKKSTVYIPIGSAITSYSRCFTIRAAQMNYYGKDKRGFIYADTDSIHCDLAPEELRGIKIHPSDFCCWKVESCWDEALYVRQKTYIEHVVQEDMKDVEPYYNVRCAGMPEASKKQFVYSMTGNIPDEWLDNATDEMIEFVQKKRKITDFRVGLKISGKLTPKQIKGGVVLQDTMFEIKPKGYMR